MPVISLNRVRLPLILTRCFFFPSEAVVVSEKILVLVPHFVSGFLGECEDVPVQILDTISSLLQEFVDFGLKAPTENPRI